MSTFNPAFVMAAAHGITARTIATWYPQLPRTPRVMVPVHLEALPVRAAGGSWADCGMLTPQTGASGISRSSLLPPPFQNLAGGRPPGVYLHWALPDGLTAGAAGSDASAPKFQAIPNRWLVLRLSTSPSSPSRRSARGWVLRSGDAVPTHLELDSFTEDGTNQGTTKQPLTAMGHGDPGWAAYFDNVVDRLAFYDPLNDTPAPQGPLAYLVCGWYTDPSLDPLGSSMKSLSDFDAQMAAYGWELASGELHESVSWSSHYITGASMMGLPTVEAFNLRSGPVLAARIAPRMNLATAASFVPPAPLIANAGATPAPLDSSGLPMNGSYTTNGSWWPTLRSTTVRL